MSGISPTATNAVPGPKLPLLLPKKLQLPSGRQRAPRAQSVPEPPRSSLRQTPMASAPRSPSAQIASVPELFDLPPPAPARAPGGRGAGPGRQARARAAGQRDAGEDEPRETREVHAVTIACAQS